MKKKILPLFLALTLSVGLVVPAMAAESNFTDVNPNAYYAEAVDWAVENGITSGTSATTFSPDKTCTRAQIAVFIWRSKGSPEPKLDSERGWAYYVPDVPDGAYYSSAARWITHKMNYYLVSNDTPIPFRPNDPCTRLEAVEFLHSVYGYDAVKSYFTDVSDSEAVDWAASWGITSGTSETTFSPNNTCTRGQIVTFLLRAVQLPVVDISKMTGTYVLKSDPEKYELTIQLSGPRLYIVCKNKKYDAVVKTGNLTISILGNRAFTDNFNIIAYPGYLIVKHNNNPSVIDGTYILESQA